MSFIVSYYRYFPSSTRYAGRPEPDGFVRQNRTATRNLAILLLMFLFLPGCVPDSETTAHDETTWQPDSQQEAFLDRLQEDTFDYFRHTTNPDNGLVPDRYPDPPFSSIAAVGFGLSSWIIGAERGYVSRSRAVDVTLNTLRFFRNAPQGPDEEGMTGHKGFFYHFLDMDEGGRYQTTELSTIDTALLIAGMLTSQSYFDRDTDEEREIRALVDEIYERVDWAWVLTDSDPPLIGHGWRPESGFIPHDYSGYDEAMILYLLAIASPTHPAPPDSWDKYTETYQWDSFYGYEYVNYSPLFVHQFTHMFVDFRGIWDDYMSDKGIDYFENSRRATLAQREYAIDNPGGWLGYGENIWGLTACDGPGYAVYTDSDGEDIEYMAYSARGASATHINDDGTIAPYAAGASMPFAPRETIEALHHMYTEYGDQIYSDYGFLDSFNMSFARDAGLDTEIWVNDQYLGIDQGPLFIQIENYRSELIWDLLRDNEHIRRGLDRAGFTGGWLDDE